jgi:hypothetical protein
MSYTTEEGRERILTDVGQAADQIELALSYLSDAYELVDVSVADRLEEELFAPAQAAYARAKRTLSEFSARHRLPEHGAQPRQGAPRPHDARGLIEGAVQATEQADHWIGDLQDSMLPIEVGDQELRAGLSETRALVAPLPARGRELVRILGR